ncbi:MAG TPA: hypothetical protein VM012_14665 [Flavitalea sp.]|nr:hypothetical protein [Flavitalea sp.]
MRTLLIACGLFAAGCSSVLPILEDKKIPAAFPIKDSLKTFVLIDAAEVVTTGMTLLKKRKAVLEDVKKEYMQMVPEWVENELKIKAITDTSLTADQKKKLLLYDSAMISMLRDRHGAEVIAILKNCYGGFEQDDVVTEKDNDGTKTKTAFYSVFFESTWQVIQGNKNEEKTVRASKPHSSRSVASGLLARGPAFKANKSDILQVASDNAFNFTGLFEDRHIQTASFHK